MAAPPQRSRPRRALLTIAVVTGLLPAATACGGVHFAAGKQPFTTMGYGLGDALATVRLHEAQKALGDTKIQVNEGAFDEQQFLSAVAADDAPDVVHMDRALIGGYAARGAIVPLTDCLQRKGVDLDDFRDSAMSQSTLDGTVYSLPDSYDNRTLLINGDVLKAAGHSLSDVDTSDWKSLKKLAKDLHATKNGKVTRIGFDPKIPEFFPLWVHANGGRLISKDGRTALLDTPKVIEALRYTVSLINAQGGWGKVKSRRDSFDMFGKGNPMVKDQIGVFPMEDWYLSVLGDVSPQINLDTRIFKDRKGDPLNFVSGYGWAIPKGSPHPKKACTFITTITSAGTWVKAAKAKAADIRKDGSPYIGDFTGNKVADRRIRRQVWKPTGNQAFDDASHQLYAAQEGAFSVPANPGGTEFRKAWQDAVNRVLSGETTPEEALKSAQKKAQSILDLANQGRE
ncbi:MAG TPA: extracellular solute-binding protein [Streptomyces sp.]|nr:extracellular solute-binding protein [Streptomyces sp.]